MQSVPSSTTPVLALGELLWDLLPSGKLLGGAPANCCFRLRQLGIAARMASRVGCDSLGDEIVSTLRERGFDLSLVQRDSSTPTGTVDVRLGADGSPDFTITQDVAYDFLDLAPALLQAAHASSLICFGTLVQRSPIARNTVCALLDASPHAERFLDINLRKDCFSAQTVLDSLTRATILKLNAAEVEVVSTLANISARDERGRVHEILSRFDLDSILVTRGADGVYAVSRDGEEVSLPGISVRVVDTIGSGDSFSAGFIAQHLRGATLRESCHFGNINGALNATKAGGMPTITPAEIDAFMREHPVCAA